MSASPYYDNEIRRPFVNVAQSQTDAEVWPAEPGKKLRVLAAYAIGPTATALTFNRKGAGGGTAISGAFTAANGVPTVNLPFNPHGWFETEGGQSLTVTTGAGGTTAVMVVLAAIQDGAIHQLLLETRQPLLAQNQSPLLTEAG